MGEASDRPGSSWLERHLRPTWSVGENNFRFTGAVKFAVLLLEESRWVLVIGRKRRELERHDCIFVGEGNISLNEPMTAIHVGIRTKHRLCMT